MRPRTDSINSYFDAALIDLVACLPSEGGPPGPYVAVVSAGQALPVVVENSATCCGVQLQAVIPPARGQGQRRA
jgi:hypothetical protein